MATGDMKFPLPELDEPGSSITIVVERGGIGGILYCNRNRGFGTDHGPIHGVTLDWFAAGFANQAN
jgi:hypothetical protein